MRIQRRIRRAVRELLNLKQWPIREKPDIATAEQQIYAALIRDGDCCFDIGANGGEVSILLARLCGEDGLVVSFEPVWITYTRLCRALQVDQNVKAPIVTVPMGLADAEKDVVLQMPQGDSETASMAGATEWRNIQGKQLEEHYARFTTLDAFLALAKVPAPTFLKIDVEGAELFVLRGASKTFDQGIRPLMFVEIFAPWEQAFAYTPWEPLSWLADRGYRFLYSCPQGLVEHTPSQAQPTPAEYRLGYNVVAYDPAVHADRIDALKELRVGGTATILPMPRASLPNVFP